MILRSKVEIQRHIGNLKELKEKYLKNGDSLNVRITTRLIEDQEATLKSFSESGD